MSGSDFDWDFTPPISTSIPSTLVWVVDPVTGMRHTAVVPYFDPKKHIRFNYYDPPGKRRR